MPAPEVRGEVQQKVQGKVRREVRLEVTDPDLRIDQALLAVLQEEDPGLTRARLKILFQEQGIFFRGRPVKASFTPGTGTHVVEILLSLEPSGIARPEPSGPFLPVLHEDEEVLILNKAPGVPSIPHTGSETGTAVNSALAHEPSLTMVGRGGLEPGILHRLDTGTSGLLLFAKNQETFERLRAAWRSDVKKTYRAIIDQKSPELAAGEYSPLLAHDAKSDRKMRPFVPGEEGKIRGKPLPTLTRILDLKPVPEGWDLELEIETGVMHQIRCTLASLGCPIRGDTLYKGSVSSRLWLHAWKLELPTKKGGTRLIVESPLPEDWPKN